VPVFSPYPSPQQDVPPFSAHQKRARCHLQQRSKEHGVRRRWQRRVAGICPVGPPGGSCRRTPFTVPSLPALELRVGACGRGRSPRTPLRCWRCAGAPSSRAGFRAPGAAACPGQARSPLRLHKFRSRLTEACLAPARSSCSHPGPGSAHVVFACLQPILGRRAEQPGLLEGSKPSRGVARPSSRLPPRWAKLRVLGAALCLPALPDLHSSWHPGADVPSAGSWGRPTGTVCSCASAAADGERCPDRSPGPARGSWPVPAPLRLPGRPPAPADALLARGRLGRANGFLQGSDFLLLSSRALCPRFLSAACSPLVSVSLISINTRVTESQNSRGWKGPLWVIQSNPPAQAGSPTAGCTGSCPGGS